MYPKPPVNVSRHRFFIWMQSLGQISIVIQGSVPFMLTVYNVSKTWQATGLLKTRQIMCTKGICGQVLIATLNRYPLSTLNRYSINTSVDTPSTLHRHLGRQSVKSRLIFDRFICLESVDTRPMINQLLIKWRQRIDQDVHRDVFHFSVW